jgi:signal transduction histidine kinase
MDPELRRFAQTVAHDLAEPLRTASGFLELLDERHRDQLDDQGREFLGHALTATQRIRELLDGLLALALGTGEPPAAIALDAVVERALAVLRKRVEEEGAVVEVGELPEVVIDATQAEQLFTNLISNALKFRGPESPRIEISSEIADEGAVISFSDNGRGISAADRRRIFEPLERASGDGVPGYGLGLAIAKGIVDAIGGRVWVEAGVTGGSTFRVLIPKERLSR